MVLYVKFSSSLIGFYYYHLLYISFPITNISKLEFENNSKASIYLDAIGLPFTFIEVFNNKGIPVNL
jgi:hypothetical protein